jgi:hypothetical protein
MFNGHGNDNSIKVGYYDAQSKFIVQSFLDEYVVKGS